MPRPKKMVACDCETDPFLHGRIPRPFVWGLYDGKEFKQFDTTDEFVAYVINKPFLIYAHNGGKFDFMYLLPYVKETKAQIINGRIVSMYLGASELRDSFAAVPESLKNIQKDEIDYHKLEAHVRHLHMPEIIAYLRSDCVYLYNLMNTYRKIAGTRSTIASNALAFVKKLGIQPGKTNHRFDHQMRRYYYGGRTECPQPGTHKNIKILDIHSSYPYAMLQNHATGSDFHWRDDFGDMSEDEIARTFITLECTSKGAFPKRAKGEGGLMFPHEYNEFKVTGWEYLVALEFGLISDVKIQSVGYTHDKINFAPYVLHWYKYKNEHSAKGPDGERLHPNEYTTGKYMMNSFYGKLSQNPARYYDYKIVQAGTPIDEEHGWQLGPEFDGHEIHRRESLWKYRYELGVEWKAKKIYHNVASGSSITGFARAHLLRAMHTVGMDNVIYCDTDSVFCVEGTDVSGLPQSEALGDWELEEASAPIGHFAGKKLYAVRTSKIDKKTGKPKDKIASKGSKLAFQDLEKIINGETVVWESPAPSFSMTTGHIPRAENATTDVDRKRLFVRRNIRATAQSVSTLTPEKG